MPRKGRNNKRANAKHRKQGHPQRVQRNVKDRLFRFLFEKDREALLKQEYQMVAERAERSIYGTGQISLPTPQCVVFYNGTKEMPEEQTLRLSDAFENKNARADVELTVRMLNINRGYNKQLMEKCRVLEEYSQFVAATRDCMLKEKDMQAALNRAVDGCIERGILKEFLLKNRSEVCASSVPNI